MRALPQQKVLGTCFVASKVEQTLWALKLPSCVYVCVSEAVRVCVSATL